MICLGLIKNKKKLSWLQRLLSKDEEDLVKKQRNSNSNAIKSKLAAQIQNLIRLIFDVESMKRQMKEFEVI